MSKTRHMARSASSYMPLDQLAGWIGRRSRLIRFALAGLIALSLTAAVVLLLYGYLFSLTPNDTLYTALDQPDIVTKLFIVMAVVGFFFYWIGWRLMIGFDLAETPLVPGRGAAIWMIAGIIVFIVTACLSLVTLSTALQ